MSAADDGRTAVYAAEIAAFEGTSYEALVPFETLLGLATRITGSAWWPHGQIAVRRARSDASSSSARQHGGGVPVVRLAEPQMTPATLVHEFAHVLAGVGSGHGPQFRRAHIDLVAAVFGTTEAEWLCEAYEAMGLAPGARTWPEPDIQPSPGAIAL